jgi:hypothetical protein
MSADSQATTPAARRSRSHAGPVKAAELSALNVYRVNLFQVLERRGVR